MTQTKAMRKPGMTVDNVCIVALLPLLPLSYWFAEDVTGVPLATRDEVAAGVVRGEVAEGGKGGLVDMAAGRKECVRVSCWERRGPGSCTEIWKKVRIKKRRPAKSSAYSGPCLVYYGRLINRRQKLRTLWQLLHATTNGRVLPRGMVTSNAKHQDVSFQTRTARNLGNQVQL